MQSAVCDIIIGALEKLDLKYPEVSAEDQANLRLGYDQLMTE